MILYGITIVTSAFLLFLVQPIIAKQILPWFGGTAAVWTVCVVFFQSVLLAGYAYAHLLSRRSTRVQALLHTTLLVVSLATLPIVASSGWKPAGDADPTARIVGLLAATIGLPYFLLSSTGPLVQRWSIDDRALPSASSRVYRLFAWSNGGSLVGLLCYPFVVEPYATLQAQSWGWSLGYACFAVACIFCAWRPRAERPIAAVAMAGDERTERPGARRVLFWLACAALGSMLLLASTNHVTQNVASIPFLWVLPLTLYLLSFVVVFEGRGGRGWYVRHWWQGPALAAVIAMAWALSADRGVLDLNVALPLFSIGLFAACVLCHGELAATRPAPAHLTQFYLCLAAGGALGGLFVAVAAPRLFDNYWETPIALFGVCVIAALTLRDVPPGRWAIGAALGLVAAACIFLAGGGGTTFEAARAALPWSGSGRFTAVLVGVAAVILVFAIVRRTSVALIVAALACTGFYGVRYYRFLSKDTLHASRSFYGALRVKESGTGTERRRDLLHGVILHGDQYPEGARRRKPTTYYGPGSGIALALRRLRPEGTPLDVAMIGLGAGTLAAWGKSGDRYRIYEINPDIVEIARRDFSYLADSPASIGIAMGDARLSMERELVDRSATSSDHRSDLRFDIIAVDAFSSDSIPVHLITREALDVFVHRLKPDGIVAFHVSNRFLRLAPVVAQMAHDADLDAIDVVDETDDDDESSSEWVLVTRNAAFLALDAVRSKTVEIAPIPGLPMWTDQYNNLFKILK